ncbi:MAG: hypothetical protein RIQ93_2176 [Verrucomicrobiota bacterium]|jgi:glucose-6-phosphate dehydrogenase assembly protein OpcA
MAAALNPTMSAIFDALPGLEVPVAEIASRLAGWWAATAADGKPAPGAEDAKATQVNFVLHFGLNTTPADAETQFQTVVRFSHRYPSRIVVLCPLRGEHRADTPMRAKIYGECYLGKSKSDKRCVEFVMLSYSPAARQFLENQVSICLSADLPLYYWAHRFTATSRLADYRYLLTRAKRVLIDSAFAPEGAFTYPWPNPNALRDLVDARLLPVRQSIGQFLASYPPATLTSGLRRVMVIHEPSLTAEGRVLLAWLDRRLAACRLSPEVTLHVDTSATSTGGSLQIEFHYAVAAHYFRWSGDLTTKHACLEANFGAGKTRLTAVAKLLEPEMALSEAMFF